MSQDYKKVLELEEEVGDLLENNVKTDDERLINIVEKLKKILKKISNDEILNILSYESPLHFVIQVATYLKKYKINKKELKESKAYKEEFEKLNSFALRVRDIAISEEEYRYICYKCDIDSVAEYLLKNMTNEDIMELSNASDNWDYKLFLYGNLKNQIRNILLS